MVSYNYTYLIKRSMHDMLCNNEILSALIAFQLWLRHARWRASLYVVSIGVESSECYEHSCDHIRWEVDRPERINRIIREVKKFPYVFHL